VRKRAMAKGREVQQRGKNDGKRERTMANVSAQRNGRGEKAMERKKKLEGTMVEGRE